MAHLGPAKRFRLTLKNRTLGELQKLFPKLRIGDNFQHTSEATPGYNCVGFANGDSSKWWQFGIRGGGYYWPVDLGDTLEAWVELFAREGYSPAENGEIEPGVEKIAIYANLKDFSPSHVAKSDGTTWKSKLGRLQDISHVSLDLLEGPGDNDYGFVQRILQRPLKR